ncbi:SecY-interacting protein [Ferrimonas marina]|uniref:SecY interacting protein Syd n=1 Tax=Ferrimonas marina TaxID=299255 RepID=A0A1M5YGA1_9GAMM|nr:SecY-interacting protein [Ferrimonas marina]SHI10992.1 SecY interacting protein Syd [Ferrimonas marina]
MSQSPLTPFIERYQTAWQQSLGHGPVCDKSEAGPALDHRDEQGLAHWHAVPQPRPASFDNIAEALELSLHPALTEFYSHYYAGPLLFDAAFGEGELLQVWNRADLDFLQENLIGHLMMKRKLKQAPTLFIGLVGDGDSMLVLDNGDGSVWLEVPGQPPQQKLADSIDELVSQLSPRVVMPEPVPDTPAPSQQGLLRRFKTMWGHLRGRRQG